MTAGAVTLSPPREGGSENGMQAGPRGTYAVGADDRGAQAAACGFQAQASAFLLSGKRYQDTLPSE